MADASYRFPWGIASPAVYASGLATSVNRAEQTSAPAQLDLETIYRIRRREMIRYLISFGVDLVEAEDITQEIFLKCFGATQRPESSDNLFRWALVCAENLAINRYRRQQHEVLAPASLWKKWEQTLSDSRPDAEMRLQEEQRYRNLTEWISTLSDIEQECAILRSQGIPFREIAISLNLPMRKVVYITSVAIQKLKRQRERQAQ